MRKALIAVPLIILLLGLMGTFWLGPEYTDRSMNRVDRSQPLPAVTDAARALHQNLLVVDLHADPLLWKRDLLQRLPYGQVDLPRLQEGNVSLQVFGSPTKTPRNLNYDSNPSDSDMLVWLIIFNAQPLRTWFSLYERARFHAQKLSALVDRGDGRMMAVRSAQELQQLIAARQLGAPVVGGLLGLEGAHALEGKLENLDGLYAAGYRMIGLAHFFDNEVAGSMHGEGKTGLTPLGRAVVQRAESLGMIIDIAHASNAAVNDVFDMATRPVVVSHGGVRAMCDYNRNLSDAQLRRLASNGGVIGIGYWDAAVCDPSPAGIVQAMTYVRGLIGVEHIALGSDFDGTVTTRFDTSELVQLTQALLDAGYTDEEIRLIMGGNALRVLQSGLP
ncbi:MAG: dipeptidase [Pseudomonadota bacterium]